MSFPQGVKINGAASQSENADRCVMSARDRYSSDESTPQIDWYQSGTPGSLKITVSLS